MFVGTGAALMWYFEFEKGRVQRKRIAEAGKGVGAPKVGGPFELIDQDGKPFTSEMMKGKHALVRTILCSLSSVDFLLTSRRSTSASRGAQTSAPRNSTRWHA